MYSVISQSDPLEAHAEIADKTEDYLWLKLCQIQFEVDPSGQDQYTLQKLQSLLYEEYGKTLPSTNTIVSITTTGIHRHGYVCL